MRNHGRRGPGIFKIRRTGALRGFAVIFALFLVFKIAAALGADVAAEGLMTKLLQDDNTLAGVLMFEFSGGESVFAPDLAAIFADDTQPDEEEPAADMPPVSEAPVISGSAEKPEEEGALFYVPPNEETIPFSETAPAEGKSNIQFKNTSGYTPDIDALLAEPLEISLQQDAPAVLIIHTHASESYTPEGDDQYVASDPYRTQDDNYNMIRVGNELQDALESRGIKVIHDTGVYDYPSYSGSYGRSLAAMKQYVSDYPSIGLVIDLHRDAIGDSDGAQYRTIAQIDEETCSQIMFVVGTNSTGLEHPEWRENLKLALHLQREMDEVYPTLSRPIKLSENRYNQQVTTGSLIVEVGCTGNTLAESLSAVRYFADAAANVILGLYE